MADITIQKTTIKRVEYSVIVDQFNHADSCESWKAEFGRLVMAVGGGSGFVPARLFISRLARNKTVTRQLKFPWNYCPFCGYKFTVDVVSRYSPWQTEK